MRRPNGFPDELNSWERIRPRDLDPVVAGGLEFLGDLIRSLRRSAGLSQRVLAKRAGVSQSTISRLERHQLASLRLQRLARIIGVLVDPRLGRGVPEGYLNRWS